MYVYLYVNVYIYLYFNKYFVSLYLGNLFNSNNTTKKT